MAITIFAQSLKNDGSGDIVYNNKYIDFSNEKEKLDLTVFFKRARKLNNEDNDSNKNVEYIYTNGFLIIEVISDELDNIGRLSPILIESHYKNLNDVNTILDIFLEKSGRHLSEEKRKIINKAIYKAKSKINKYNFLKTILIGGLICGVCMAIYSNSNKVIPNTLIGFLSGAVLSAITFYITKKISKGDKND
jgi:hypothetical protein